jgi:hypothetical protein
VVSLLRRGGGLFAPVLGGHFDRFFQLMGITNLFGCRIQRLHPPLEDFVVEFIGEKYF